MELKRTMRTLAVLLLGLALVSCISFAASSANSAAASKPRADAARNAMYNYSLGVRAFLGGNAKEAIQFYERALQYDPKSPLLAAELSTIYIKTGQTQKAIAVCEKSLESNPNYIDLHLLLGGLYLDLKDYGKAEKEFKRAIELDPKNLESYLYTSIIYAEGKKYQEATELLQKLLKIDPRNLLASYYLAKVYAEMKKYPEAEKWFKRTLEIKPSFDSARLDLAAVYDIQNKNGDSIQIYEDYLRLHPARVDIRLKLAKAFIREQKFKEGAGVLQEVLKSDPANREVIFTLGLIYFFEGNNFDAAIAQFKKVLDENSSDQRARFFLASSFEEKKDFTRALQEFQSIPETSELYSDSVVHVGMIMKKQGKMEEAIRLVNSAIPKRASDPGLYIFLASLYQETKRPDLAEETIKKGLLQSPEKIDLHYRLGMLYESTNRFDESIREMQEVLRIEPENAEALNFIGYGYAERGIKLDVAEALIKRALKIKPANGYIIDSLGWVYFRQSNIPLAIKYLKHASELLPEDPQICEHLGDAYEKGEMFKEALETYRRALKLNPGSSSLPGKIQKLSPKVSAPSL